METRPLSGDNVATGIRVIVNAGSGSVEDAELVSRIRDRFLALGLVAQVVCCEQGGEIGRQAEEAVREKTGTVVAGGGDGTISAVAAVVAGTPTALGVLPLGTLNHFAKDLGIPLDLDAAIATIAAGHAVSVDIGEVNGRVFVNNSSLGLYPKIVRHREVQQSLGYSKWRAFLKGVLTVLGRYPLLRVRLLSETTHIVRKTPFVFIGNNEYEIHGLNIGTRSRIDAGELSVYIPHQVGRLGLLWLAVLGLFGRLRDAARFDILTTTQLLVDVRSKSVRVALDGEVLLMEPPLSYRCRKGELRVIVPET